MKRVRKAREDCWKTALQLNLKAVINPSVRVLQPVSKAAAGWKAGKNYGAESFMTPIYMDPGGTD